MLDIIDLQLIVVLALKIACIVKVGDHANYVILGTILLITKNVSPVPPSATHVLVQLIIVQPVTLILFS